MKLIDNFDLTWWLIINCSPDDMIYYVLFHLGILAFWDINDLYDYL